MDASSSYQPDLAWLQRRWGLPESALPWVVALLEAELNGNTAVEIPAGEFTPHTFGDAALLTAPGLPEPSPEALRPLVLLQNGSSIFLQSWLYFKAEHEIADNLRTRAQNARPLDYDTGRLGKFWQDANDLQKRAAETALAKSLLLLSGGPGTGKTFTLALILTALSEALSSAETRPRVILTAPTGKAADQMKHSVNRTLDSIPEQHRDHFRQVAEQSRTLHKTLGYNPATGRCKYNEQNPLDCEALIIDESSMCDALLFRALLRAGARPLFRAGAVTAVCCGPGCVEWFRAAHT